MGNQSFDNGSKFSAKGKVRTVTASIVNPEQAGLRMIVNVVGHGGKFEGTLGDILAKRWMKVREDYKHWHAGQQNFKLGAVNTTSVASDTWVVSLLVRDKTGTVDDKALAAAVKKLGETAQYEHASVHVSSLLTAVMPTLPQLLTEHVISRGVNVSYYSGDVEPQV